MELNSQVEAEINNSNEVETLQNLQNRIAYEQNAKEIVNRIHSAKDTKGILIDLKDDILGLLDAERITIYAVDHKNQLIYSKYMEVDETKEIRVSINDKSISGYVAKNRLMLNISNVYDKNKLMNINANLSFDSSWDQKTGFKSKQALAVPIVYDNKWLMGVIQLLNKKSGPNFTEEDEGNVKEIAKTIGIAFYKQHLLSKKIPTKFDYLLAENIIAEDVVSDAISEARRRSKDVESILLESFNVPKKEIGTSLSLFYNCEFHEFDPKISIPQKLFQSINVQYLKKNFWVPLRSEENSVEILIDNPNDIIRIDEINSLFKNKDITFSVGLRGDILEFLKLAETQKTNAGSGKTIDQILEKGSDEGGAVDVGQNVDEVGGSELSQDDSTIVQITNTIIVDAYNKGASDIHVEPYGAKKDSIIRFRVDGSCFVYKKVPSTYRNALVSRLKIMSRLDISEKRKPQDGKIKFLLRTGKEIELRVATIPTCNNNEDVVMRILAASEPIKMEDLGMSDRNLAEMKKIIEKPYGIILCVGPTGSGKTTTLHSCLGYINKPERKIWTAEDPVEITQYGLRQVQVLPKIGFTFAAAMRSFLRADPDVIMVGEMRDEETAHIAIEASLTGHLVLSTLHTNSAPETIIRLLDMGLDPFNFADAILGVLAQRLIKRLCDKCKEKYHPNQDEYNALVRVYGEEDFEKLELSYDDNFFMYRAKGCDVCKGTGYKGRAGIHELLIGSVGTKKLIQDKARVTELSKCAKAEGMTTLVQDGILKILMGITDIKQVRAVAIK